MNILITGIAGFVGANLAERLSKLGHNIYGVDNLSTGDIDNLRDIYLKDFFKLDLTDETDLDEIRAIIKKYCINTVIHLAAQASIEKANLDPKFNFDVNLGGTISLLELVKDTRVSRVIFASSMTVYGNKFAPFYVGKCCEPVSSYGISKFAAERYLSEFCKAHDIQYTCFRPFNIYGPKQDLNNIYQGVAAIFIGKAINGEDITIYGDGNKTRDFIHIDDVCHYFIRALHEFGNRVIDLGTGKQTSIRNLAEKIIAISSSKSRIIYKESRKSEQQDSYALLNEDFRSYNFIKLDEGLRGTIEWNKTNLKL